MTIELSHDDVKAYIRQGLIAEGFIGEEDAVVLDTLIDFTKYEFKAHLVQVTHNED